MLLAEGGAWLFQQSDDGELDAGDADGLADGRSAVEEGICGCRVR